MDIYKAIKMEKKSLKRFYRLMIILFIGLPLSVYLTGVKSIFYLVYLLIIELLIIAAVINKLNYYSLKYNYNANKLNITNGLFANNSLILCDKVVLVHTEKMESDMEIIIISTMSFRNKSLRPIVKGFLKKYPKVQEELKKVSNYDNQKKYYFQIIRKGGLSKYLLLDTIYKNCVKAIYTNDCIENIKIARGQILV
ncbi:MAG: hypothetical protein ACLR02_13125 [Clostridium sp.]|jgi:hypothetical protein|nr:hypothetical protein [Clostridium sp.]